MKLALLSNCSLNHRRGPNVTAQHEDTSPTVWKQEPDGFKGVKFGVSRSDVGFISEQQWLAPSASYQEDHCSGEYLGAERCERIDPIGDIGLTLTYFTGITNLSRLAVRLFLRIMSNFERFS